MKVEIDKLFSSNEFRDIVSEKWVKQYQKNGKLQTDTKTAITKVLLKHYETAEYVKGTRSHKAYFEIGNKRTSELSSADMINEGIKKSNIASYKLTAYKLFKHYVSNLDNVEYMSKTRLQWLKSAGITSDLRDFHMLNAEKLKDRNASNFVTYYQNDLSLYLKQIFSYCVSQLKIEADELYYCDAVFDDEIEKDENGRKKRLLTNDELNAYNEYRNSLKKDEHGNDKFKNFYNAPREFKKALSDYVQKNFKSNELWVEIELNLNNVKIEKDENVDVDKLRKQFIKEFKQSRDSLYVKREFRNGKGWRYDSLIISTMTNSRESVIVPYRQMEERNYFKFMTELDSQIGLGKANMFEYKQTEKEYKKLIDDDVIQFIGLPKEIKNDNDDVDYDKLFAKA